MEKDIKLRIKAGLAALLLMGGMSLTKISPVRAEGAIGETRTTSIINIPFDFSKKEETQVEEKAPYIEYKVINGDNLSLISKKICRYFGTEETTKYWPVLAFLNSYPRIINPGDIIIYPSTIEKMDALLETLNNTGWIHRYAYANQVYATPGTQIKTVKSVLTSIYGDIVDDEFVIRYLNLVGLSDTYDINTIFNNPYDSSVLADWVPTLEELGYPEKTR